MNARHIIRRPAADEDVRLAAIRIAQDNPRAAIRFINAVRTTEEALLHTPGMGTLRDYNNPALTGMRWHSVRGFRKYLVFYIPRSDGIEVVRVLHGARDLDLLFSEQT
jgi:toxin ParE1/3/4